MRPLPPVSSPDFVAQLKQEGVEVRGCDQTRQIVPQVGVATETDWQTEYLDKVLSVKMVRSLDEALDFIHTNGSGLADCIVSEDYSHVRQFLREVDSATVYATLRRASPMALSSDSEPRSAFRRTDSTPGGPWACVS